MEHRDELIERRLRTRVGGDCRPNLGAPEAASAEHDDLSSHARWRGSAEGELRVPLDETRHRKKVHVERRLPGIHVDAFELAELAVAPGVANECEGEPALFPISRELVNRAGTSEVDGESMDALATELLEARSVATANGHVPPGGGQLRRDGPAYPLGAPSHEDAIRLGLYHGAAVSKKKTQRKAKKAPKWRVRFCRRPHRRRSSRRGRLPDL